MQRAIQKHSGTTYAKYFSQAVESAVKVGRLRADFVAPSIRYSTSGFPELSTPFNEAQVDVYHLILQQAFDGVSEFDWP